MANTEGNDIGESSEPPMPRLPPTIPPISRWNFVRNWWQRSETTSEIAEARLLSRLKFFRIDNQNIHKSDRSRTIAKVGLVPLRDGIRKINTLVIEKIASSPSHLPEEDNPNTTVDKANQEMGYTQEPQTDLTLRIRTTSEDDPPSDKKVLVIAHGYGAGLGFFYRNYNALSQVPGWKLYAIDWLGMGRSSRPKWRISKKQNESWDRAIDETEEFFVDSLEEWREIHKIEKMTLLGHSLGGYLSACYAIKYPDRVEKLILVSPAGIPENPTEPSESLDNRTKPNVIDTSSSASNPHEDVKVDDLDPEIQMAGAQVPESQPPPTPRRRLPTWVRHVWEANITPMSIMRKIGPFGPYLVNAYTTRRFHYLDDQDKHDLYDYIYHISSSPGSGEYAMGIIFAPGAYARRPTGWIIEVVKRRKKFYKDLRSLRLFHKRDNPPAFDKAIIEEMTY
ncbi:uncharacterized protein VTP21DRAFT_3203 [Calcarisporiella thermophila]|uniref:uncharacterized protein n=1 Tax=Calcarisporiella thermophila TaxID=911321 RepID=UPI003742DB86